MEKLDLKYLSSLVHKAQLGDSNAFAELYTATYQNEFAYACKFLQDRELAKAVLKDTYGRALREINKLAEPELIIAWLYRINFQICYEKKSRQMGAKLDDLVVIEDNSYRLMQLTKHLPMTEAQVLIMYYYQNYTIKEIMQMLGIRKSELQYNLKGGRIHLKKLMQE